MSHHVACSPTKVPKRNRSSNGTGTQASEVDRDFNSMANDVSEVCSSSPTSPRAKTSKVDVIGLRILTAVGIDAVTCADGRTTARAHRHPFLAPDAGERSNDGGVFFQ